MNTKRPKKGCQVYVPYEAVALVVRKDGKIELAIPAEANDKEQVPKYILHTTFFAMAMGEPDCAKILDRMVNAVVKRMQKKIVAAKKLTAKVKS